MRYRVRQLLSVLSAVVLLAPFLQVGSAFADNTIGLNAYNVNINTRPDLSSGGTSFAVGSDGNFWYANGNVAPQTSICSESLASVVGNTGNSNCYTATQAQRMQPMGQMVTGTDGDIWFVSQGVIGQMTTSGTLVAQYKPDGGSAVAVDITPGPNGDIWFIGDNYGTNTPEIGSITPSGVMTEYDLPSSVVPRQITSGPNGDLWFTAYDQNSAQGEIGETTPTGDTTLYPVPYFNSSANESDLVAHITAGSDGNVWFASETRINTGSAEAVTWYMNEITPDGVVTGYQLPVQENLPWSNSSDSDIDNTYVYSITTGSDGNVWYAFWDQTQGQNASSGTDGTSYVGNVTPAGSVTQYATPYDGTIYKILTGPDGNIWAEGLNQSTSEAQLIQVASRPAAPTNLTASTPAHTPVLSWTGSQNATYYNIYRNGSLIDAISADNTTYTDVTASPGSTDTYYVTAVSSGGESGPSNSVSVAVIDPAPVVGAISASTTVGKGASLTASAPFTYADVTDTHTATWNWGDDSSTTSGTVSESNGSGTVSGAHTYSAAGSYTVTLTVTNENGTSNTSQFVVAVSPNSSGTIKGNLSGMNYSNADLSNLNLTGSNLQNTTFNTTNFQGSSLAGDNAPNASFQSANFTNADLAGATFQGANFTGANLTGANLKGANFKDTNVTNVTWSNTICPDGTNSNNNGLTCIGHGGGL